MTGTDRLIHFFAGVGVLCTLLIVALGRGWLPGFVIGG